MKRLKVPITVLCALVCCGLVLLGCETAPATQAAAAVSASEEEHYGGGPAFWDDEVIREETGHCYRPIYDTLSWSAAEAEARAQGGYLVVPNDPEEHAWLIEEFGKNREFLADHRHGSVHIGLTDRQEEGVWRDVCTGEKTTFAVWAPGEPNNVDGREHYAEANLEARDWNDVPEDTLLPAVVEFDADPFLTGLSAELGFRDQYYGVRISLSLGDGQHTAVMENGRSARKSVPMRLDDPSAYLYFQVDDDHYYGNGGPLEIRATYLDNGYDQIWLEYDSRDEEYKWNDFVIARENTNRWKTRSVTVSDAGFMNRQNGWSDFRFGTNGDEIVLARVEVRLLE